MVQLEIHIKSLKCLITEEQDNHLWRGQLADRNRPLDGVEDET